MALTSLLSVAAEGLEKWGRVRRNSQLKRSRRGQQEGVKDAQEKASAALIAAHQGTKAKETGRHVDMYRARVNSGDALAVVLQEEAPHTLPPSSPVVRGGAEKGRCVMSRTRKHDRFTVFIKTPGSSVSALSQAERPAQAQIRARTSGMQHQPHTPPLLPHCHHSSAAHSTHRENTPRPTPTGSQP